MRKTARRKQRPPVQVAPMPYQKYQPFAPVALADRSWPNSRIMQAPRWCSVDLRDGNQALLEPMNPDEKLRMFELLLEIGFKEIEVGFPAASETDYQFVRKIIENNVIPEDVTIQVLCQARTELIEETIDALQGVPRAVFHLYNSTSTLQRQVVFRMSRDEVVELALAGVRDIQKAMQRLTDTDLTLEYSPESFTGTELDFAVRICTEVCEAWGATPENKVIINLPATVEMSTPNIYADQIEWFSRHFKARDSIILSLHPHNDRGTAIAATELGLMAGADRVEGTLFGNGERTGNVDVMSLAMNLFSQGVNPELQFGNMPEIVDCVEAVNKLPVHPRHPYAGELVFTAFSGSHQDAIRKAMSEVDPNRWAVPYLPIDPADVRSSYRETVRVNSQSGKGGVAFILEHYFHVNLTRDRLIEFAGIVQKRTEETGGELTPDAIWKLFQETYVVERGRYELLDYHLISGKGRQSCTAKLRVDRADLEVSGKGEGPIEAFAQGVNSILNEPFELVDYHEQALGEGSDAGAIAQVTIRTDDRISFGAGISTNTITASFEAIISAANRDWLTH